MPALFRTPRLDPRVVPTCEVEIDWAHDLAVGLEGCWPLGGSLIDAAGNAPGIVVGTIGFAAGPMGPALSLSGAGAIQVSPPSFNTANGCTLFANILPTSLASRQSVFDLSISEGSSLEVGNPNGVSASAAVDTGGYWAVTESGSVGVSQLQTVAYAFISPRWSIYLDGTPAALSSSTTVSGFSTSAPMFIGQRNGGSQRFMGLICGVSLYSRTLSAWEIAWLDAEPFAMLRPRVRRPYVTVASVPSGAMAGSANAASSATGELLGTGALAGTSAGAATSLGAPAGEGALSGAALATETASAAIKGSGAIANDSAGAASAEGALVGIGVLAGTTAAIATAAGIPVAPGSGAMAGAAVAAASATGALIGAGALAGTSEAASAASGAIAATGAMTASAVAAAAASGTLAGFGPISGVAEATAGASGMPIGTTPPHVVSNSHGVRSAPTIRSVRSAPTIRSVI